MLLNLVSASGSHNKDTLWGFIERYNDGISPLSNPGLDKAADYAISYYNDFVKPNKSYRLPDGKEAKALSDLCFALTNCNPDLTSEELQKIVYSVGVENNFDPLKHWFRAIYEVLLGESQGPRFGGFIALYGIPKTIILIEKALNGSLINE